LGKQLPGWWPLGRIAALCRGRLIGMSLSQLTCLKVENKNSSLCMELANDSGANGTRINQDSCLGSADEEWQINSNINDFDPSHFALANGLFPDECMAAANSSDTNQTPIVISACSPAGSSQVQTWQQS
jgi:hypothetical protein